MKVKYVAPVLLLSLCCSNYRNEGCIFGSHQRIAGTKDHEDVLQKGATASRGMTLQDEFINVFARFQ